MFRLFSLTLILLLGMGLSSEGAFAKKGHKKPKAAVKTESARIISYYQLIELPLKSRMIYLKGLREAVMAGEEILWTNEKSALRQNDGFGKFAAVQFFLDMAYAQERGKGKPCLFVGRIQTYESDTPGSCAWPEVGSCGSLQHGIQCEPLIFGDNVCVSIQKGTGQARTATKQCHDRAVALDNLRDHAKSLLDPANRDQWEKYRADVEKLCRKEWTNRPQNQGSACYAIAARILSLESEVPELKHPPFKESPPPVAQEPQTPPAAQETGRPLKEAVDNSCAPQIVDPIDNQQKTTKDPTWQTSENWTALLQVMGNKCGKDLSTMINQFGYCHRDSYLEFRDPEEKKPGKNVQKWMAGDRIGKLDSGGEWGMFTDGDRREFLKQFGLGWTEAVELFCKGGDFKEKMSKMEARRSQFVAARERNKNVGSKYSDLPFEFRERVTISNKVKNDFPKFQECANEALKGRGGAPIPPVAQQPKPPVKQIPDQKPPVAQKPPVEPPVQQLPPDGCIAKEVIVEGPPSELPKKVEEIQRQELPPGQPLPPVVCQNPKGECVTYPEPGHQYPPPVAQTPVYQTPGKQVPAPTTGSGWTPIPKGFWKAPIRVVKYVCPGDDGYPSTKPGDRKATQ